MTQDEERFGWGVWLGRHIRQNTTRVSQEKLSEDRNLVQSERVKAFLIQVFSNDMNRENVAYRSFVHVPTTRSQRCQKSYHRDNWLVAAKRPQRRCFLILRCRLFLSLRSRIRKALDCSPTNRERELGLDRRETGQFYPTDKTPFNGSFDLVREEQLGKVNSEHYWLFNQVVQPTSFGSCLNASKAESMPKIDIFKGYIVSH